MKNLIISLFLWGLFFSPVSSMAENVTSLLNNGPSNNRVDIVILGDGYTSNEMSKFKTDAQKVVDTFFKEAPFNEYKKYFNVRIIEVISNESGADHSDKGIYKDTALDAGYNCQRIARLLCTNYTKVNSIITNNLTSIERDIQLIIVNDTRYGGAGGITATASTNSAALQIMMHEIGHSFGKLGDEYTYGHSDSRCTAKGEPPKPNLTKVTDRALIKWNQSTSPSLGGWINPSTVIPTTVDYSNLKIGLYDGGYYCGNGYGIYRPTVNSKMRTLTRPFEEVNEEQFVKRIYNKVSPLQSKSPTQISLSMKAGETTTFKLNIMTPSTHTLDVIWKLNDVQVGTSVQYVLNSNLLNSGTNTLSFEVKDNTTKVRNDPSGSLTEKGQWKITLESSGNNSLPVANAGLDRTMVKGNSITISGTATDANGSIVSYKWYEGTALLSNNKTFSYKPTSVGKHTLKLIVTDNDGATDSDTMIVIATAPLNKAPAANAGADKTIVVNNSISISGSGTDSDGTIASYKWYEGTTLRSSSRAFSYKPTSVGNHTLKLIVTDNDGATASDTMIVIATAPPNKVPAANAGADKVGVIGKSLTIAGTATDSDGTIASYKWYEGTKLLSSMRIFVYKPASAGTKTITLIVTDNDGATDSDTIIVNVSAAPTSKVSMAPVLYILQ